MQLLSLRELFIKGLLSSPVVPYFYQYTDEKRVVIYHYSFNYTSLDDPTYARATMYLDKSKNENIYESWFIKLIVKLVNQTLRD